ncbi:amino acid transporter [Aulographum hederae CBS 113979]|uniref:Amino acid transporter n=1 Tax=Aulographum hederae CBS 113979 TaxID=1176131 RepID=A0A6G1GXD6_9PEZI|nr:amino acid transporter [Aulographum hederae CBS 113979]
MGVSNHVAEATALVDASDQAALEAAGKKQVLKREWNFWAALGMAATTLCTWEATSALFAGAYTNGGPASVVYGFIVSIIGTVCIAASLAEMASISPIAGAQYHWTAEHSPPQVRVFMSWIQGWVTVVGWQAAIASVCFIMASVVQGLIAINHPSYVAERWHATLLMIAFNFFACLANIFARGILPITETLSGFLHVLFFFVIMIALLATSEKADNADVWASFINGGGWSNDGVSFCLGFITPAFALAGIESVVHMSEETHNAPTTIPRAMIGGVAINGICGFAYILTILYAITDADAVLTGTTGQPILEVFMQATNSVKASSAMLCAVEVIFGFALFGVIASQSRLMWAFGRDRGLPFPAFVSHITAFNQAPTNAILITFSVTCVLSLINIASTTAFNALIALSTLGFYFSYIIPIIVFALRRFNTENPIRFGPWNMGKIGLTVNILAMAFCTFLIIFLPFPPALPITGTNMNYAAPVFIFVMGCAILFYFVVGKKVYHGPIREVEDVPGSLGSSSEVVHDYMFHKE